MELWLPVLASLLVLDTARTLLAPFRLRVSRHSASALRPVETRPVQQPRITATCREPSRTRERAKIAFWTIASIMGPLPAAVLLCVGLARHLPFSESTRFAAGLRS